VLRPTTDNHETVASVKLRALLSRLMKKSIRKKSVITVAECRSRSKSHSIHEGGKLCSPPSQMCLP